MADQKFCLRLAMTNGTWLAFLYNSAARAKEVFDLVEEKRAMVQALTKEVAEKGGIDCLVDFEDDFGYRCAPDVRNIMTVLLVGTYDSNRLQNELSLAALKGKEHFDALVDADPKLKSWVMMKQRGGQQILLPPQGGNGGMQN